MAPKAAQSIAPVVGTISPAPLPGIGPDPKSKKVLMADAPNAGVHLSPDGFGPPFDVVHELTHNRSAYVGDEWLSFPYFPSYLRTCLDRVRRACSDETGTRPGLAVTVSCCLTYGLTVLAHDPDVGALLQMKERLDAASSTDVESLEELAEWFRGFSLGTLDISGSGGHRQNITVPPHVRSQLCEFSADLGTYSSSLGVLAMSITLADQTALLPQRKDELSTAIDRFFKRVITRRRVAEVWLESLMTPIKWHH